MISKIILLLCIVQIFKYLINVYYLLDNHIYQMICSDEKLNSVSENYIKNK